jgi:hypothetical protein
MKKREPKPDDQENARKACKLIAELVKLNPNIDNNCWVSACLSSVASTFEANGIPYPQYLKEMERAIRFYEHYWEEDVNTTE